MTRTITSPAATRDAHLAPDETTNRAARDAAPERPRWLTIRMDASYCQARGVAGFGFELHATNKPGRDGEVVEGLAEAISAPPAAMEHLGLLRALELAQDRGARHVRIRTDSRERKTLKKAPSGDANALAVEKRVRLAVQSFAAVKFAFIERRKNQVARGLAHNAAISLPAASRPDLFPGFVSQSPAPQRRRVKEREEDRPEAWEWELEATIRAYEHNDPDLLPDCYHSRLDTMSAFLPGGPREPCGDAIASSTGKRRKQ